MNYLQKVIIALGIEPTIAYALLIILTAFLAIITIVYICVPVLLLRMRKELIELNKNLRILYILDTQTQSNAKAKHDSPSDLPSNSDLSSNEDKLIEEEKPATNIIKLQLEDEDIKKLRADGVDIK